MLVEDSSPANLETEMDNRYGILYWAQST